MQPNQKQQEAVIQSVVNTISKQRESAMDKVAELVGQITLMDFVIKDKNEKIASLEKKIAEYEHNIPNANEA